MPFKWTKFHFQRPVVASNRERERERERERGWMSWKENIEADESSLTSLFDP